MGGNDSLDRILTDIMAVNWQSVDFSSKAKNKRKYTKRILEIFNIEEKDNVHKETV